MTARNDLNGRLLAAVRARRGENVEEVRNLLAQGANPNGRDARLPLLTIAARDGRTATAPALAQAGADLEAADKEGPYRHQRPSQKIKRNIFSKTIIKRVLDFH